MRNGEGWLCVALGTLALSLSGCAFINKQMFSEGQDPLAAYQSTVSLKTEGAVKLDYEILGEGYGESAGYAVLGGLILMQPDFMEAYREAVRSKGGDFLLEVRRQTTTSGVLTPIIYTKRIIKVWGLVAKRKG